MSELVKRGNPSGTALGFPERFRQNCQIRSVKHTEQRVQHGGKLLEENAIQGGKDSSRVEAALINT